MFKHREMTTATPKTLNIALWVAQVVLGGMFIMAGVMKATTPIVDLVPQLPWAGDVPEMLVRFIGISELLGGIGLILPALLRMKPILTPYAATGLVTVMVFAAVFHITRGEYPAIGFNFVLGAVAAFIAWGRFKKAPIQPKK
jgi:putative oxidoreductase